MLDSVALERRGKPTAVVAHHTFEVAARTHAKVLGLAGIPLAVMSRPAPDWDEDRMQAELRTVFDRSLEGIGVRSAATVPAAAVARGGT